MLTLAMSIAGAYLFGKDRRRLWALSFATAAASRFLVTTGYLAVRLLLLLFGRQFEARPNFDEHNVAEALQIPTVALALVATAFLALFLLWLFRRVERGSRMLFALALIAGVGAGGFAWTALAPPVLATSS